MQNQKVLFLTKAAMIAAVYVVLTYIANFFGLANMAVQVRFSEALTVLPFFTAAAIPGLTVGCLLANFLTGCHLLDIVFGSLATLLGALTTYAIGLSAKKAAASPVDGQVKPALLKWLAPLPPIFSNAIIVPFILIYVYELPIPFWTLFVTVGLGQVISCGALGMPLLLTLEKNKTFRKYLD